MPSNYRDSFTNNIDKIEENRFNPTTRTKRPPHSLRERKEGTLSGGCGAMVVRNSLSTRAWWQSSSLPVVVSFVFDVAQLFKIVSKEEDQKVAVPLSFHI